MTRLISRELNINVLNLNSHKLLAPTKVEAKVVERSAAGFGQNLPTVFQHDCGLASSSIEQSSNYSTHFGGCGE